MEKVLGLNWAIAKVVRQLRESKGLTQNQLAGFAGLSAVYISQLERGIKGASVNALMLIARVLEVSLVELMGQVEAEVAHGEDKQKAMQSKPRPSTTLECGNCLPNNQPV